MNALSSLGGTGRYEFLLDVMDDGHLYGRLERREGSDAQLERVSFFRRYDSLYVDRVEIGLSLLTAHINTWEIARMQLCSDELLKSLARDPDYPLCDLREIRWFCETYKLEISCIRAFAYADEGARRLKYLNSR